MNILKRSSPPVAILVCIVAAALGICVGASSPKAAPWLEGRGNTPLHRAALAGDAREVELLLAAGANPRATNDAGATPLHYGAGNERIAKLLLRAGADPNTRTVAGSTPLHSAVAYYKSFPQVKRLLEAGAQVDVLRGPGPPIAPRESPLSIAAFAGDERTVKLLLNHGAAPGRAGDTNSLPSPAGAAAEAGHERILRILVAAGGSVNIADGFTGHALNTAAFMRHGNLIPYLLDHGSDLHETSGFSERVPPMVWSAYNESGDFAFARALLARGVDINESSSSGSTALSWALKRGETPLVAFLRSHGAKEDPKVMKHKTIPDNAIPQDGAGRERMLRDGVQRAVSLLQQSSDTFLENRFVRTVGCISCHQQSLPALAFARARERGFRVDESSLARQLKMQHDGWSRVSDLSYEMAPPTPAPAAVIGYGLYGLHALDYQPNEMTSAMSWYLAVTQLPDGSWPDYHFRPPMEGGPIVGTALALRALQYYPPALETQSLKDRILKARRWLERSQPETLTQSVFRYQGLSWASASPTELRRETGDLLARQRPEGGWAQLIGLESDAWATGHTLVALHEAGGLAPGSSAYQRGVTFLMRTQFPDGSWWVKSRTWPFQPHFDGGFPHGKDQWISAGATAWAAMALLLTLDPVSANGAFPTAQQLIAALPKSPGEANRSDDSKTATPTTPIDFNRDIRPVLESSCVSCHGGQQPKGGYSVETLAGLLNAGQSGDYAVVPGKSKASPLIRLVSDEVEDLEMPPLSKRGKFPALTKEEIVLLASWIDQGAIWPEGATLRASPK